MGLRDLRTELKLRHRALAELYREGGVDYRQINRLWALIERLEKELHEEEIASSDRNG